LGFVLLTTVCSPAIAWLALGTLEWQYPPSSDVPDSAAPLVVLAGAIRAADDGSDNAQLADDSLVRCVHAATLYRRGPRRLIILSGGKVDASRSGPSLARVMHDFMRTMGIPEADLLMEDRSRTTYENAVETAKHLRERKVQRIVLVTEAVHLLRADLCFRKLGFRVTPVGCNYQATTFDWLPIDFLPSPKAAVNIDRVAHEWLGLIWYRLQGRV
jgi:uncharacterized SAM-binding protein YcdF (DUF218 family)